jgi:hypothetical protein
MSKCPCTKNKGQLWSLVAIVLVDVGWAFECNTASRGGKCAFLMLVMQNVMLGRCKTKFGGLQTKKIIKKLMTKDNLQQRRASSLWVICDL